MKQPPTKKQVLRLIESCDSPGARLAVALAAFSGLDPGQIRALVFQNLVEFSTARKQFSQVPARIELWNHRSPLRRKYYTFLSTHGCRYALDELKARNQTLSTGSPVVPPQAFKEADRALHDAAMKWHVLRDFFASSFLRRFVTLGTSSIDLRFKFGHAVKEDDLTHVWQFFNPDRIEWMRDRYTQVEKQFFI